MWNKILLSLIKNDKKLFFIYLQAIERNGLPLGQAIRARLKTTPKTKAIYVFIKRIVDELENGNSLIESLVRSKLISHKEHSIFKKASSFAVAVEHIFNTNDVGKKSKLVYINLVAPGLITLVVLLASHGTVKKILMDMIAPIAKTGAKGAEIPGYLLDNTIYMWANIISFSVLGLIILTLYMLFRYKPYAYFKIMPLTEKEYAIDVLYTIKTLKSMGLSLSDSIEIILEDEQNHIKRSLFEHLANDLKNGKITFSKSMAEFGFNTTTVSLLELGEQAKDIMPILKTAHEEVVESYNYVISKALPTSAMIGKIIMLLVFGKPFIDIMMQTSVSQLNFTM